MAGSITVRLWVVKSKFAPSLDYFEAATASAALGSVYECLRKRALSAKMGDSACARVAP
jgi:hypothetical protein